MDRLMPFDELNVLSPIVADVFSRPYEERRQFRDYLFDEILEILILSYMYGNEAADTMLDEDIGIVEDEMRASLDRKVADKTWTERFDEYMTSETATAADIMRIADTDAHRIYNEAIENVGRVVNERSKTTFPAETGTQGPVQQGSSAPGSVKSQKGVVKKTWVTMADEKVRATHDYLEGETIPFEDDFYTFDGDYASRPGGFLFPENNINCRCRLILSKGE